MDACRNGVWFTLSMEQWPLRAGQQSSTIKTTQDQEGKLVARSVMPCSGEWKCMMGKGKLAKRRRKPGLNSQGACCESETSPNISRLRSKPNASPRSKKGAGVEDVLCAVATVPFWVPLLDARVAVQTLCVEPQADIC